MYIILHISDSDKHFSSAIEEYMKRLWKSVILDVIKPFKDDNKELVIKKETQKLIERIKDKYANWQKVLLIKEGKQMQTEEILAKFRWQDTVFVIWWPYGIDDQIFLSNFPESVFLSFGKMTMPHWLAKLVLLEQIYRIWTIETGKSYHY